MSPRQVMLAVCVSLSCPFLTVGMRSLAKTGEDLPPFDRPIRIPVQVPLGNAQPPFALAGEAATWRLQFELGKAVASGGALFLETFGGRHNKGQFSPLQTESPAKPGYVTAGLPDGTRLQVSRAASDREGLFQITVPEKGLPAGAIVMVTLGDISGGGAGTTAPEVRMLNKFFLLQAASPVALRRASTQPDAVPRQRVLISACRMHILGGDIDHLRAYVPSQCTAGEKIEVLIRPEDRFSNLSHQMLRSLDVFSGDLKLDAEIHPVPGSNCVRIRITAPAAGTHRFRIVDRGSGKECPTNPTDCTATPAPEGFYWGMIHGHTEMSDGWGTLDHYLRQMRDEAGLDFAATSDHDHLNETPDEYWSLICDAVKRFHQPGRFVTFLGYEWAKWRRRGDGDRNVYYLYDDQPMFRSDDGHYPTPPDLFRALAGRKALIIPHHPAEPGNHCDYKDHDPEHERLIEIHQVRGCYECSPEMGNPIPAKPGRGDAPMTEKGWISNALAMGWRVGFTANGDDHIGTAGTERPFREQDGITVYAGGMAVLARQRTREAIWEALWNRRVVATSGPRVLLRVALNGQPIGSELSADKMPELRERRSMSVWFRGTAPVKRIEIIRNNTVAYTTANAEFIWEDKTPLADALLPAAKYCDHPFSFYYVRVVQTDGQAAWASPIWIDP